MTLLASSPSKRSARRCLFGKPDPKQTKLWLDEQLEEIRREKEAKWSFDFERELILPSSSRTQYQFVAVDPTTVPEFYHLKVITSRQPPSLDETSAAESEDSDWSLMETSDCSSLASPLSPTKRHTNTPRRPPRTKTNTLNKQQSKMTDYLHVKKRLRRPAKVSDLSDSHPNQPSVRSPIRS